MQMVATPGCRFATHEGPGSLAGHFTVTTLPSPLVYRRRQVCERWLAPARRGVKGVTATVERGHHHG